MNDVNVDMILSRMFVHQRFQMHTTFAYLIIAGLSHILRLHFTVFIDFEEY